MKFVTDKAHRDYFYKNGTIEFDGLLNSAQIQETNLAIDNILCKSLSIAPDKLALQSPSQLFQQGRDLFRKDEVLKKILLHQRLAEIAVELLELRTLRMGYDQLFIGNAKESKVETAYHQFLQRQGSLQEKSCITPIVCALMLCLEPLHSLESPSAPFSKTAGNGVFLNVNSPLDLSFLSRVDDGRYLLLVYAVAKTVYILNENDPHTHTLKRVGYVFGDTLSDKLNPLIIR